MAHIADIVEKGQILAYVGETPVEASITGVLRGIIKEGYNVPVGMKIADIDPRKEEKKNCFTISDKARCIAGSVVEILLSEGVLPTRSRSCLVTLHLLTCFRLGNVMKPMYFL